MDRRHLGQIAKTLAGGMSRRRRDRHRVADLTPHCGKVLVHGQPGILRKEDGVSFKQLRCSRGRTR
jgi:hypothetical protein